MGREIKRIALDFKWPCSKVWEGYLNPYYRRCPGTEDSVCVNGNTPAGAWLDSIVRFLLLCAEESTPPARPNGIYPHPYLTEFPQAPTTDGGKVIPPSKDFTDIAHALTSGRPQGPIGYCGVAGYEARLNLLSLLQLDKSWGICPQCNGSATDHSEAYDNWEPTEPPEGPGWQVWETVSEGSPVSPVFPTSEALVDWLCQPKGSDPVWTRRSRLKMYSEQGQDRSNAEAFVRGGWAPSLLVESSGSGKKVYSSIESVGVAQKKVSGSVKTP